MCENSRIGVTSEDMEKIKALALEEKDGRHTVYEKIINSIAPSLYNLRFVKESVMLQMFGGVSKKMSDETMMDGNIHILLVGDPCIGKSKILSSVHMLAPNAVLISNVCNDRNLPDNRLFKGRSLRCPTHHNICNDRDMQDGKEFFNEGVLTPEMMAMADNGILVIDDVHFMQSRDWRTLVNVMKGWKIPIVKDEKFVETDTHFSTLITSGPCFGRFDPYRPMGEQIGIPINILALFDIILSFADEPKRKKDSEIAEHILRMHSHKLVAEPEIKPELLKKYITYARKNVFPALTEEAEKTLKEYYINLRRLSERENAPVPVTPRQLESLIKLIEASARIRLSNEVSKEDAERAIKIFEDCCIRGMMIFDYETGTLDVDLVETGMSRSYRETVRAVLDIINKLSNKNRKGVTTGDIIKEASSKGLSEYKVEEAISFLVDEGMTIKKEYYRLPENEEKHAESKRKTYAELAEIDKRKSKACG